ncbi:hypothetical protein [Alkalihalophilus marmarensis]|uniref:hypothetical protein n=1 Tax=Alkalihalophilus marmarensis TaxID=521377 RepID=UPI002DB5A711|nr:hypothetical protein [Alkalihalophilus marmarensis]MEC2072299.1 hypothetical protein [Alkalihalophilus marmarensis]
MSNEDIASFIENLYGLIMASQFGFGFGVLLLGKFLVEYYEWGIFEPPETRFQKSTNFFMKATVGGGPYIYNKYRKYSWLTSRFLYIVTYILAAIAAIIGYFILDIILHIIFL